MRNLPAAPRGGSPADGSYGRHLTSSTSGVRRLLRAWVLVAVLVIGGAAYAQASSAHFAIGSGASIWPPGYLASASPKDAIDAATSAVVAASTSISIVPDDNGMVSLRGRLAAGLGIQASSVATKKLHNSGPTFDLVVVGVPGSPSASDLATALLGSSPVSSKAGWLLGKPVEIAGTVVVYRAGGATYAIQGPERLAREILRRLP